MRPHSLVPRTVPSPASAPCPHRRPWVAPSDACLRVMERSVKNLGPSRSCVPTACRADQSGRSRGSAMTQTVAELMVDTLHAAGIRRVYGVAGDSLNGFTDALSRRSDMQWVHVRHEETAAFAAG